MEHEFFPSSKVILSLDMSTTCTGWSVFDIETKKPIALGTLKPKVPGLAKMEKYEGTLSKMLNLAGEIRRLIHTYGPRTIVIEEIAGSKNRLGQKTLDGFHWIVILTIREFLPYVVFYDVGGSDGWRTHLRMNYSEADKLHNKEAKKLNKKLARGIPKIPEVTKKTLAARYANREFGMVLDVDVNTEDADIADSLCMGHAFLRFRFATPQS